jgi:hypothetical protein
MTGFLSPVPVVAIQVVTVVMIGLLVRSSAGELAMEGLLWVRLEEESGRGDSGKCSRIQLFVAAVVVQYATVARKGLLAKD